jgi:hypothetical protein
MRPPGHDIKLYLNPQEHAWKAVRKEVSHNHLEPRLPQLADVCLITLLLIFEKQMSQKYALFTGNFDEKLRHTLFNTQLVDCI